MKTRTKFAHCAIAWLLALFVMGAPALGQQKDQPEQPPKQPVPVDQLPPLNLGEDEPETPEDEGDTGPSRADIPKAPEPLPVPEGPAVVRADLKPTGERYFKIYYDGETVGWSRYRVTGFMKLGEADSVILESAGELRLGFGDSEPQRFASRLMLDRKTLRPGYYKCVQNLESGDMVVECVYSKSMVAQTNTTGDNRNSHFHSFEGQPPQLVFNNLWGHVDTFPEHYWLMVRSAVKGGVVESYDPILRGGGKVVVFEPKDSEYEFGGRTLKTKVYPISDLKGVLLARVTVSADSFELLEVEEVGSGLKMVKSDPGIIARLKKLEGLDLTKYRIVPSNVVFNDPEQLTALEADVEIGLRGGQLADHRIAGYRQYFTGELKEGKMKGKVFVRSVPREVPFDTPFPLDGKIPDDLEEFTKAGPGIEMEFPPLATKAREITWKSPSTFEAAKRLNGYVYDVEEGVSLPSARFALETGIGNAESKALLLVAMSRAVGLPARKISGVAFREGNFVPHHWTEIWLGRSIGWTPFDPITGEAGRVGATHIALLDSGDVQHLNIRVTDYSPRSTKKVPFIARELQWNVGEKRTYGVYKDGKKIGTEVAHVGDIEVIDGEEVYRFTAHSEIQSERGLLVTTGEELLRPQALPRRIVLTQKDPETEESTTTFEFEADTVVIRKGKKGDEGFEEDPGREYPCAKGTYFTDPRLLTQWALLAGQVPLDELSAKEFTIHSFLPDRRKTTDMLLEVAEKENVKLSPRLFLNKPEPKTEEPKEDAPEETPEEPTEEAKPEAAPESKAPEKAKTEEAPSKEDVAGEKAPEEKPAAEGQPAETKPEAKPESKPENKEPESEDEVESVMATHLISDTGLDFWLNDKSQIVKIEIVDQGLELILEKVESTFD